MFIGHLAVGFAGKRVAPRVPLWLSLAAVNLVDLIWPVFVLGGVETVRIDPGNTRVTPLDFVSYPYSHSLVAVAVWGLLAAVIYLSRRKDRRGAAWIAFAVVSHWVLDWISHGPDMPLSPWTDVKVGLGLWNSVVGTAVIELAMFGAGIWIYLRSPGNARKGNVALWSFVAFILLIYAANLFSPPPPSVRAVAIAGLAGWFIPLWGVWIDRATARA